MENLRVVIPNRQGAALELYDAIASKGINVEGTCGDIRAGETWGYVHVLVEDGDLAAAAVEEAGFQIAARQRVDLIELEDRPGQIAKAVQPVSGAGRNITVLYMAMGNQLVLGTEDMLAERAEQKMRDI